MDDPTVAPEPSPFGAPFVCAHFDLEAALKRENIARMAREDEGLRDEDEMQELEALILQPAPQHPDSNPSAQPTQPLSRAAKKKLKKRAYDRSKRQAAAEAAQSHPEPPAPTPRVLKKAAESSTIKVTFSAADFRASQPRWTGATTHLNHPLLEHARDAEFLKKRMLYADWQGKKTHVVVDKNGHIIAVLVAPPVPGEEWAQVVEQATAAMRAARDKMSFPTDAYHHRRAFEEGFPVEHAGFSFGGGREEVGNIRRNSARNAAAMDELLEVPSVRRFATYPYPVFQALCYPIYEEYYRCKQALLKKYPGLRRTFSRSPYTAVTANLGPCSMSPPHLDSYNKADGMCQVGALGKFDADKGGHFVCWDYDLIVRFPAGCSILIPSAVVTHSNTPIQEGEERYSLIQYTAGGLFRWVANGFKSDKSWFAKATETAVELRECARQARWSTALRKFARWKDVKVGNYTGRGRVEVWDSGELADFSDLTDVESDGEEEGKGEERPSPAKKIRCE